jgi:hypothetical protein
MGNCCHGSAGPGPRKSRLGWWVLGALVAIVAIAWVFQGNRLVDLLSPLALGSLALVWLVAWTLRRMGIRR